MAKLNIPAAVDSELRDVAKDIIRGARSNANLLAGNAINFSDVVERLDHHVRSQSDQQYRVERASDDERQRCIGTVMGVAVYCVRVDNRTQAKRYFAVAPCADPIYWPPTR